MSFVPFEKGVRSALCSRGRGDEILALERAILFSAEAEWQCFWVPLGAEYL
jgi:hypothetical protein